MNTSQKQALISQIRQRYGFMRVHLSEKNKRLWIASESITIGRGDPESPLRWTCKSTYKLSEALRLKGYKVSQKTVHSILKEMGYSMQANRKIMEGKQNPDRDAQFHFINKKVKRFQASEQPVISVDAKKKENIGQYKNSGAEWEKHGQPTLVNTYDFPDKKRFKNRSWGRRQRV